MKRMLTTEEILQIAKNKEDIGDAKTDITNLKNDVHNIKEELNGVNHIHEVTDLTALTTEDLRGYALGDIIYVSADHNAYVVSYKDPYDVKFANLTSLAGYNGLAYTEYHYTRSDTEDDYDYDGYETINVNKVNANPVLAGTESALEGIEIGGTKYKVGGGDLYLHMISFHNTYQDIDINISCAKSSALTPQEIASICPPSYPVYRYEGGLEATYYTGEEISSTAIKIKSIDTTNKVISYKKANDTSSALTFTYTDFVDIFKQLPN